MNQYFVLNPDPYSLPCYRIGPFQTTDLSRNQYFADSDAIDEYFRQRFKGKDFIYTTNGRNAINVALKSYNLKRNDVVTILTTSGNFYISGCVTKEIEKFCKWSRELLPETKLIFINHEFGYPFPELPKIKEYGLPIIEDCAGSFFSQSKEYEIGTIGDFVIFSFPKMFPIQIGGLLVSKHKHRVAEEDLVSIEELRYTKNVLSEYIGYKDRIIKDRISNYQYLRNNFETLNFRERFALDRGVVPGVFMFRTNNNNIDLPELKKHYYAHGVHCSVFYGEESFYIPVHQALTEQDMNYFIEVVKSFIGK